MCVCVCVCVYTQAWPSPRLLLLEGRREVAGMGEGASSLEAGGGNAGRKPPLRRVHPTLGILEGPPLLYPDSRAVLGARATEPPCGGQG